MKKAIAVTCLYLIGIYSVFSQNKYTVSGQLKDAETGEDLLFANVIATNLPGVGTSSNNYGFYSLTLPEGEYIIRYQYMGYKSVERNVSLTKNVTLDVELAEDENTIEEIVVTSEKKDRNITRNQMSVTTIDPKTIQSLPSFGGEPDIIKVMQTKPGVKAAGEGNSGFYVRGGGLDQNLILLDEAPVYNPSHLLGFFSVFNSDALSNATMYKGTSPSEYGGRTSSVMDIRMKEGSPRKYSVSGGIGLIASKLTVDGPIVKDKGSFIVSGRRTYADLFLKLRGEEYNKSKLYFYDLNLKANYRITDKDRIYLSGYMGRDKLGYDDTFGFDWGNATATARWNHVFSGRLFSNTSVIYSNYDYQFGFGSEVEKIEVQSVIKDFNFKQDFSYFLNSNNSIKFGVNVIDHTLEPGNLTAGPESGINSKKSEPRHGIEGAVYAQNEQKINSVLALSYGIRYSFFRQRGPGTVYNFDDEGNLTSTEFFEKGNKVKDYGGFEPRLSATYIINDKSSVKAGASKNYQYLHVLSNSTASSPTDTWIMSSNNINPQSAIQGSLGYFRNFAQNRFETSVELYYKIMDNVIEYRNGANVFLNDELEGDLLFGDGKAYGAEFTLEKTQGKLTGWVSYTLSRTKRQFDKINNGSWYAAKQDRIHDISVVATYQLNKKYALSANYIYYTGDAITFPTGGYLIDGKIAPYYTERNGYRLPNYRRLDLSITKQIKKTEKFESSWNISLFNAFGTQNPYSISFRQNEDDPTKTEAVQIALFRWVPSFTYNFKF